MALSSRKVFVPYNFLVTLPDRLYPFRTEVQGKWVRGLRAYNRRLAYAYKQYGRGHYGYALSLYRHTFHLMGALIIIALGAFLASSFILILAIIGIAYQEFVLQRRTYRQLWSKGIADWLVWSVPMGVYVWMRLH